MNYWKRLNADGSINTVESYSHNLEIAGAIKITKRQFNEFIASLPVVEPEPVRDPLAEIDEIKIRVEKLEKKYLSPPGTETD